MRAEYSLFIVTAPHAKYYTIICLIGVWLLKSTDQSPSFIWFAGLLPYALIWDCFEEFNSEKQIREAVYRLAQI